MKEKVLKVILFLLAMGLGLLTIVVGSLHQI